MLVQITKIQQTQYIHTSRGSEEVVRRHALMSNMADFVDNIKSLLGGRNVRANLLHSRPDSPPENKTMTIFQLSNMELAAQQEQQLLEQDEKLDLLDDGVQVLKALSRDINLELDIHASLLEDLDRAVDKSQYNMKRNIEGVESLYQKGDGTSFCPLAVIFGLLSFIVYLMSTNVACTLSC